MAQAGQWLPVDVIEQAGPKRLAIDLEERQRRMLGLQFDRRIAAMADLEHEAALVAVHAKVEVLLAAQHLQRALQVVVRPQQGMGLGLAK
ncbi:hypothetical protein WR25_06803 [Diploscapter pachys]|uniref:Uncharacterized protein n=1 Tax=Diploscapter pachys TaxID=2018661 RepID=A0A2A2KMB5_9BILA|nr:hypothetical protein WR25_06803 [Diploscapter pachys]